ncbi:MAG: M23 family metallopeptidase [Bacteroidales bacterium]|nr:M23 family metallopeptidase [Bacteroidales bacterium]
MGEWIVTQGHSGEHTHKESWRHAWDFEICDENGNTYAEKGNVLTDYFSYNKPVVAPADGWIEEIIDNVEDNDPRAFNLRQNWGNTVVIRHFDGLYSKMSHLRKGSLKVEKGNFVKKGDKIALCGNSGRSPQPHIHFQMQATPYIGSATLDFPIGRYILHHDQRFELISWGKPENGQLISNIDNNNSLSAAFNFIPGQQISFTIKEENKDPYILYWNVEIDLYNYTYLHCHTTGSKAYFRNDPDLHCFTWFHGDKKSLLYAFYLGAYKIAKGYYPGLIIKDEYPLYNMRKGLRKMLQDFVAPFHLFVHSEYIMEYISMDDELGQTGITLQSSMLERTSLKTTKLAEFSFFVDHERIERFVLKQDGRVITASIPENTESLPI